MANGKDKLDAFWDLKELVPPKKVSTPNKRQNISAVEITVSAPQKELLDNSLNFEQLKRREKNSIQSLEEYINFTPFIKKVVVQNWGSEYNYYDLFRRHALYYRNKTAKPAKHEHFFSYMPQYSQMNQRQIDWYLWWRDCVNRKIYHDTDYPYILLYIFEIINLSNKENANDSLNAMIDIWSNYHKIYPQLNNTLGEWICDFSLIYQLHIIFSDTRITREMISSVSIPEVFYTFDLNDTGLFAKFLLSFCNSYNYRKSKFYDVDTRALYETHIPAAFEKVIYESSLSTKIFNDLHKTVPKIAFMGALCTYHAKKRIEITYASPILETQLKTYISDVIKYSENHIRNAVGIRSKLGVKTLDSKTKNIIDMYFESAFADASFKTINAPEYEKLYDTKNEEFSISAAKEIEALSWNITEKLVDAFEDTSDDKLPVQEEVIQNSVHLSAPTLDKNNSQTPVETFYIQISQYEKLFELIKQENYSEQLSYVKTNNLIFEAVIDEINEIAVEIFDDILLEESDKGYKIIDDYRCLF